MPELPEVETIRRQLEEEIRGFRIVGVKTRWERSFKPSFRAVALGIRGQEIQGVSRLAKLLVLGLTRGTRLLFHLKLTGRLLVRRVGEREDEYTQSVFLLERKGLRKELRFADARKFGFVQLLSGGADWENIRHTYGPEPLADLTLTVLKKILVGSTASVKSVLMNQAKIAGVGNIYANEALWLAKVYPKKRAKDLKPKEIRELFSALEEVLRQGLEFGGASDEWYRQVHGEEGHYQEHFLVYGQKNKSCQRCGTPIAYFKLGQRGTFYCPFCQTP